MAITINATEQECNAIALILLTQAEQCIITASNSNGSKKKFYLWLTQKISIFANKLLDATNYDQKQSTQQQSVIQQMLKQQQPPPTMN